MKNYKVLSIVLPEGSDKETVLESLLNYLEKKVSEGFKVEQILVYSDEELQLLCSETGSYDVYMDTEIDRLI